MFRRKDIIVIITALLVAAATYGGMMISRGGQTLSGEVAIYVDGVLYASVPLGDSRDIEIAQKNGDVNIVHVSAGAVHMAFSSCKNQLCLGQGEITAENWTRRAMGRVIICLPNRVVVELALEDSAQRIVDEDLADV